MSHELFVCCLLLQYPCIGLYQWHEQLFLAGAFIWLHAPIFDVKKMVNF